MTMAVRSSPGESGHTRKPGNPRALNPAVARLSATEPANAAHGAMDLRTPGVCRLRRGPENPPATGKRVSEPLLPSSDRAGARRLLSAGERCGHHFVIRKTRCAARF